MQPFAPIFHGVQNGWVTALESMTQHLSTVKAHDIILIRTGTEQVQDPQRYITLEKWCSMKCRTVANFYCAYWKCIPNNNNRSYKNALLMNRYNFRTLFLSLHTTTFSMRKYNLVSCSISAPMLRGLIPHRVQNHHTFR